MRPNDQTNNTWKFIKRKIHRASDTEYWCIQEFFPSRNSPDRGLRSIEIEMRVKRPATSTTILVINEYYILLLFTHMSNV